MFNTSLDIVEQRVARSRLAGDPADVLITPLLPDFGTMEYHRATEAIAEGAPRVERMGAAPRPGLAGEISAWRSRCR